MKRKRNNGFKAMSLILDGVATVNETIPQKINRLARCKHGEHTFYGV